MLAMSSSSLPYSSAWEGSRTTWCCMRLFCGEYGTRSSFAPSFKVCCRCQAPSFHTAKLVRFSRGSYRSSTIDPLSNTVEIVGHFRLSCFSSPCCFASSILGCAESFFAHAADDLSWPHAMSLRLQGALPKTQQGACPGHFSILAHTNILSIVREHDPSRPRSH